MPATVIARITRCEQVKRTQCYERAPASKRPRPASSRPAPAGFEEAEDVQEEDDEEEDANKRCSGKGVAGVREATESPGGRASRHPHTSRQRFGRCHFPRRLLDGCTDRERGLHKVREEDLRPKPSPARDRYLPNSAGMYTAPSHHCRPLLSIWIRSTHVHESRPKKARVPHRQLSYRVNDALSIRRL